MSAGKGAVALRRNHAKPAVNRRMGHGQDGRNMMHSSIPLSDCAGRGCKGSVPMANAHRDNLMARHARLDASLAAELKRPLPDPTTLRRLKREKLKLKDEISTSH
jgi:hypothetical protein